VPRLLVVLILAFAARAVAQPADTRAQAKRAFGRAQAAEARKDWRTAISEYLTAYDLSPHPDVLFNVAADYERLEQLRDAVTYYRRYLDEKNDAEDHAKVEKLIAALKRRPGPVAITTVPPGARIFVDGTPSGAAPLTLELGGAHTITAELDGRRAERTITVEYAEPAQVELALPAAAGVLVVTSNIAGARVLVDGDDVGATPFRGDLAAGAHVVVITATGYAASTQSATIANGQTVQLAAELVADGHPIVPPAPTAPKLLFAADGGVLLNGDKAPLATLAIGYPRNHVESWLGVAYGNGSIAYAGGVRLTLTGGHLRPYLGGTLTLGAIYALWGSGGLMLTNLGAGLVKFDIFVEGGVGYAKQLNASTNSSTPSTVVFPVLAGVAWHAGNW
jgi:tetratricopeptide (TPR) repeat protein